MIKGKVAGVKNELIVDTGSPWELLVPYETALKNKWIDGSEPQYDPRIVDRRAVRVNKEIDFEFGRCKLSFREVVAWDLEHFAGGTNCIVGIKFLNRFRFEFDFGSGELRLHARDSRPEFPKKAAAISLQQIRNDAFLLRAAVGNVFGWFLWDTGAETSALFQPAIEQINSKVAKSLKWQMPKEHTLTGGNSRITKDFVIPQVTLSGFAPGSKRIGLIYDDVTFNAIDFPLHQAGLEGSCGLPLMGLINDDIFGSERVLYDPDYSCLWVVN